MADSWFLTLDGIPGGSTDAEHAREIDVTAWSWGLANTGPVGSGGGSGAGRSTVEDLQVVAPLSVASPRLFLACAAGTHIAHGALTGVRSGAAPVEFLVLTLHDVRVSAYRVGDEAVDLPKDRFALAFGRIEVRFTPQDALGQAAPPVVAGWDVRRGTAL
jgi:type VI secretion system secreted protein Hcp